MEPKPFKPKPFILSSPTLKESLFTEMEQAHSQLQARGTEVDKNIMNIIAPIRDAYVRAASAYPLSTASDPLYRDSSQEETRVGEFVQKRPSISEPILGNKHGSMTFLDREIPSDDRVKKMETADGIKDGDFMDT
ncbi:MAG: hypothetical protein CYPHOPRED_004096 [Cyphobasidiales sp. Tagirdzhanova-0007]|nr:MAG: hypothetical protein CYPHOPRED_004096 [Cyphobasidiales sp. Tagirdzhanova-0007]